MGDATAAALIAALVVAASAFLAAVTAVFVFRRTSAILQLRLEARWPSSNPEVVILAFEVENVADVRVDKEAVRIRVLQFDPLTGQEGPDAECVGTEWVDLQTDWRALGVRDPTVPERMLGTTEILTSTLFLNPRELIHVERAYRIGPSGMLHVALQFRKRLPLLGRILDALPRRIRWSRGSKQQTATWYVWRESATR